MLKCDVCLSELVMKDDGSGAVCPVCGVVYTIERLRRKLTSASSSALVTYPASIAQKPEEVCDPNFDIKDGCLAYYFGRKTDIVIPDGVTSIGAKAFAEKSFIETVVIPDSVTCIYESAFEKCGNLHTVYIGAGVRQIGKGAFAECFKLRAVHITDLSAWCEIVYADGNIRSTNDYYSSPLMLAGRLYLNGQELTELTVPEGVTLGAISFIGCTSLVSVTIPTRIKIGGRINCAFGYCSNLRSVHFKGTPCAPDSTVCYGMFCCCDNLQSVHFEGTPCRLQVPAHCRVTSTQEMIRAREEEKVRSARRAAGLCQYCGGKFSFFTQTCASCKTKKDY